MFKSTFHGLEVSKRGIFAQQSALHTTGHNISNANTIGYSRQVVNMQASLAIPNPGMQMSKNPGLLGTGVDVTHIQRIREEYLDKQYRNEAKHIGYWEAKKDTLSKIEMILNEPSDTGLQMTMDRFWTSWQDLAKESEASSARAVVVERAQAVIETLDAMRTGFLQHQQDLNTVINIKTNEVNSITTQIRDINDQIARVEPHGYQANDLKDQRDNLIDELSKLINVDSVQPVFFADGRPTGMVRIMTGDVAIIDGRERLPLEIEVSEDTGLYDVSLAGELVNFTRGELMGLIESRGYPVSIESEVEGEDPTIEIHGIIPGVIEHIDRLATEMAKHINEIHSTGLTIDDIKNGRTLEDENADRLLFFIDKDHYIATGEFINPTNASNFMIHPAIGNSLDKIAAGQPTNENGTSSVGDGSNASAIASLKFEIEKLDLPEKVTFDDFYRNLIAKVGVQVTEAERLEYNSQVLADQVDNRRLSISGVSLDEEMANMIKFQHAYNASARAITTVDGLLDTIINRMGLVGR
ncbi:flagellar hook-associated protein FlgK [Desulfuribacillus alkaliarsenatis]|uniref:Flagellar hook-associated protein 1 n=1 Tax=Desulfuribacillus alkaliarsenatis TaxID=766136 RepID=A0A1E5G3R5_9FIRM|nr:flagellar hook-associated protein FlgK [Desulfuribacillus alkaliarsenatis]OEF97706.1 flagellar hook-associated protein FlgK [Desulfuribacillus alkaliarsenatis]